MALAWSADVGVAMEENKRVRFALPEEGALLLVDNFAILKSSAKQAMGESFINFLLRPDVAARISNYSLYASTSSAARPFIHREILKGPASLEPPRDKTFHLEYVEEAEAVYHQVWADVTGSTQPAQRR